MSKESGEVEAIDKRSRSVAYPSPQQRTVGTLIEYLKTAPKWQGDDFEECLKFVNDNRR